MDKTDLCNQSVWRPHFDQSRQTGFCDNLLELQQRELTSPANIYDNTVSIDVQQSTKPLLLSEIQDKAITLVEIPNLQTPN